MTLNLISIVITVQVVCWIFRQKWTCRQIGWICQLEVILTYDDHYFFLVSHNLYWWQQMELLWTPKLPTMHWGRMLAVNILTPSLRPPWSNSPWWPDTKEKSGEIFAPNQVINRKKSRSEQQTALVTTVQPWLAQNSRMMHWKRLCSTWINTPNKVNVMSYKWITKHS